MPVPDGLLPGGLTEKHALSLCQIRSSFGQNDLGLERIEWGTGLHFFRRNSVSYILTAAHVIYSPELEKFCSGAQLFFGCDVGTVPAQRVLRASWVPEAFVHSDSADPRWDFGVISVAALSGHSTTPVALFKSTAPSTTYVRVMGYPNQGATSGLGAPYFGDCNLLSVSEGNFDYQGLYTYAGMSGGPLLRTVDGQLTSWGVHVRGDDAAEHRRAVRLNQRNLSIIGSWIGAALVPPV